MKKPKIVVALVLMICFLLSVFVSCGKNTLPSPTGIGVDSVDYTMTWESVPQARRYAVNITDVDDGEYSQNTTSREESFSLSELGAGDYEIRIKALGDGKVYRDSEWSEVYYFHKETETGCIYTLIDNNTAYEVTKAGTATGDLVIEDVYRGKPVTKIADAAFRGSTDITSVVVGKNVTSIGANAFFNCAGLASVTLPDSLTSIGSAAFQNCGQLTKIDIPSGVSVIEESTFAYCTGLKEVNLNNVRELGQRAFTNCSALEEIVIPDSVVTIGSEAFSVASALESVTLGKGVETIGNSAFYQCLALKNIIFPEEGNLTKIDNAAFSYTAFSEISLPEGVTDIGDNAFLYCEDLASVSIPDSVTHLGAYAFLETEIYSSQASETYIYADDWLVGVNEAKKSSVEKIDEDSLKDGVAGIADWALAGLENLLTVELPSTVKALGDYSFSQSPKLWKVVVPENGVEIIGEGAFYGCGVLMQVSLGEGLQKIGSKAFYKCVTLKNNEVVSLIPESVTSIGSYAFKDTGLWDLPDDSGIVYAGNWVVGFNGSNLGSVSLRKETVGLADYAFYQCTTLETVSGLANAKYIGRGAFYGCTSLATATLNRNLKTIEEYTFYKCSSLFSIGMPATLKTIGRSAFYACNNLNELDLSGAMVESIGDYAFFNNFNLKKVDLGGSLKEIGKCAFYGNSALTELTIPDSVTKIGYRAYSMCSGLKRLRLGANVAEIGEYAFSSCTALENIVIPGTVKSVGDYAFLNCRAVTALTLGNGVENIGNYSFCGLESLSELVIPQSVKNIGEAAFRGCYNLTSVLIPESVNQIGIHAFYACYKMTVFTDADGIPEGWNNRWNSSFCPVVWGCELSEDESYVISVAMDAETLENAEALGGIRGPSRSGYTFSGWATSEGGAVVYEAEELASVPSGTTLYAVWNASAG